MSAIVVNAGTKKQGTIAVIMVLSFVNNSCCYLSDRGRDFLDVFWIDAGVGPTSIGFDWQLTDIHHSGIGYEGPCARLGLMRRSVGMWWEYGFAIGRFRHLQMGPLIAGSKAFTIVRSGEWYNIRMLRKLYAQTPSAEQGDLKRYANYNHEKPWINIADVDVDICLVLAFRAGFSPGEAVDFVLGWLGIDISSDDKGNLVLPDAERDVGPRGVQSE